MPGRPSSNWLESGHNQHWVWLQQPLLSLARQGPSPQYQKRYLDLVVWYWYSICQTQPNHIQIVRRQCCPATHSLGDSRAERKCPWSWIRSLLPTAVGDLNRGTGYNFVPKSLDAWFQRFNKTPQRSSRTTEKVNVKMRPNVTNPYLAVSICMGRWLTTQWVQHCRKVFRK